MANPQKENGYMAVANEIQEALCAFRIPGEARQVFDTILRKTYGYNKKEDRIPLTQFCLYTKLKRKTVCKAINKLLEMNLITKKGTSWVNSYRINKDFETWKPLPKKVTKKSITQLGDKLSPKKGHSKDNTKDINTPELRSGENLEEKIQEKITEIVTKSVTLSVKKTKVRKNSFNYREDQPSDAYEDAIDLDTGEKARDGPKVAPMYKKLVVWSEDRRGFKFLSLPKQYKAFSIARRAEIQPMRLQERWKELENDKFWGQRGFDWMDVVLSFNKKQ